MQTPHPHTACRAAPRRATVLAGLLVLAACAQPPEAPQPSTVPLATTADGGSAPALEPAPDATLASAPLPPVDPRALDPNGLDPVVRACVPQNESTAEFDFYETGRVSDGADVYVALEWWEQLTPEAAFDLHPALLRLRDGNCEVLVEPEYGAEEIDQSALMPAAVYEEISAETLAWKIEVAGGKDAYEAHIRQIDGSLVECTDKLKGEYYERECYDPPYAALLRRAGIDVRPPVSD